MATTDMKHGRYTFVRSFYNSGSLIGTDDPNGGRRTVVLTPSVRGARAAHHCNVCGDLIPTNTPHLVDVNGQVMRFHADCVEWVEPSFGRRY